MRAAAETPDIEWDALLDKLIEMSRFRGIKVEGEHGNTMMARDPEMAEVAEMIEKQRPPLATDGVRLHEPGREKLPPLKPLEPHPLFAERQAQKKRRSG
jgi:hypothetical protein